jgi:Xaa-Pro aminopeptidase
VYVTPYEYLYYRAHGRLTDVRCVDQLPGYTGRFADPLIELLRSWDVEVKVPSSFPAWLFERLGAAGVAVRVDDYEFLSRTLTNGSGDLEAMRAVGEAVAACLAVIKDDLSRCRIRGDELVLRGEPLDSGVLARRARVFLAARDILCEYAFVGCGALGFHAHPATTQTLRPHETIIVDIAGRSACSGFYADASRTWCRGAPRRHEFEEHYDAVYAVKRSVEGRIAPGVSVAALHQLTVALLAERGVHVVTDSAELTGGGGPVLHHSLGHGVGRELHQPPVIAAHADVPLCEGMVFAFEPGCYVLGAGGVRLEDTLEVTSDGVASLTNGPDCDWMLA